jgi:hypothetical protein
MQPDDPTQPVPIPETTHVPVVTIHPEDPDDEWALPEASKALRVRYLTGVLVLVLALGGGFWGGVVAERHHGTGTSSAASALARRFAALRAGGGFAGAAGGGFAGAAGGGFAGAAGGATGSSTAGGSAGAPAASGTVIDVAGNVLEISNAAGQIVKIDVGPSAKVTVTSNSSLAGLKIGDTVVVSGTAGPGGTVNATAVRATAPSTSG